MLPLLVARGPVTAVAGFTAAGYFGIGLFFLALRNQAIDCAVGSPSAKTCALDIIEIVASTLITAGAAAGIFVVGFTSPTPRDVQDLVFRVDGRNISWAEGMSSHRYGINRTASDPALVEYQFNSTSPVHTYYTFEHKGHLFLRHPTGRYFQNSKRSGCEVYYDVGISSDTLSKSDLQTNPSYSAYYNFGADIFNYYANNGYNDGCIFFGTDDGIAGASFNFGASCGDVNPYPRDCANAEYNIPLGVLET